MAELYAVRGCACQWRGNKERGSPVDLWGMAPRPRRARVLERLWRLRAHNVGASCVGQGQARGKPPRHTSSDGQRWPGVGSPDTRATSAFAARSRGACMNLGVGAWAGETEQGAPSAGGCSPCHRLRHADEPWALAGWLERTSARYAAAVSPVTGSPSASAVRRATRDGPLCRTTINK